MHNERESKISQFWDKNKIFEKSIDLRPKDKQYIFYDGPPFATGLPHYGHILGLTSKDLFPRFFTMRGFRCERKWGWDCHGLPIENIAEKNLSIKDKRDIESLGIHKFNETCREQVLHFAGEWKKTVTRMGKWIDIDNAYKTMDDSYMESVWWIFKKLHSDGYLYEGKKILMYCPRCETPLSKSEIAMDNSYKDVTEKTATVKFKLKDEDAYVLAWTTTPWTLIGNVALAINEQLTYAKIKYNGQNLIIAKDRLQEVEGDYEVLNEFSGDKLLNKEYEALYPHDSDKKGHYIINGGQDVTAEEGTGIVHMAIYGEFDYEMIRKYDLPIIQHVGKTGRLVSGPKEWGDAWFKDADKLVLNDLEDRNLLFAAKDYTHPYPFCYRCDTPLFYNAVDSWFVDIQKIKPRLLDANKEINWYPSHLKEGRFHQNIEAAPDWAISRNRFWATSIPVWKCECGNMEVLGSVEELKEKAVEEVTSNDLHKHIVDEYHIKCKCGKLMSRIPEVIDCWFESGAMPYAAKHYPFENKDWMQVNFPADFISEYIAQVRAWFYYMHVLGVLLMDRAPFKHCVVSGNVLAADGQKMSKSKQNFPDPNLIFEQYGADALRFYLMNSSLMRAEDLNFKEDGVKEVYRKVLTLTSNVKRFYTMFADGNKDFSPSTDNVLDEWIVSKTNKLIRDSTNALEEYDTVTACQSIMFFIDDLSTWYVRRSRDRFKSEDKAVKGAAVKTLGFVLDALSKVMAPITPFIAEDIHLALDTGKESVHLEDWSGFDPALIKEDIEEKMELTREAVTIALDAREKAKMPIRQALAKLTLNGPELEDTFLELIKDELNVKEIILNKADELSIELDTNLTPELIREGLARELIRKLNNERKKNKLTVQDRIKLYIEFTEDNTKQAFDEHKDDILKSIQADDVELSAPDGKEAKISDNIVKFKIEKL